MEAEDEGRVRLAELREVIVGLSPGLSECVRHMRAEASGKFCE